MVPSAPYMVRVRVFFERPSGSSSEPCFYYYCDARSLVDKPVHIDRLPVNAACRTNAVASSLGDLVLPGYCFLIGLFVWVEPRAFIMLPRTARIGASRQLPCVPAKVRTDSSHSTAAAGGP